MIIDPRTLTMPGRSTSGFHQRGAGGVLIIMHVRSRLTIDPRIPTMPGPSTSGVLPIRQALLAPSWKCREVFDESHETCTLLRSACEADFLAYG